MQYAFRYYVPSSAAVFLCTNYTFFDKERFFIKNGFKFKFTTCITIMLNTYIK